MDQRLGPLLDILELNTTLVHNCCRDVNEEDAQRRLNQQGNSVAFLVAHLTEVRHFLAEQAGQPLDNPLGEALANASSIDELDDVPVLAAGLKAWERISDHLLPALRAVPAESLDEVTERSFPIAGDTRLAMIAFLVQHESYHVGQLGYLRRQLGYPAMTYDPA